MRVPAHPILVLVLAGAAATLAVAIGACTDPDTQTPMCTDNVGTNGFSSLYPIDAGYYPDPGGGCEGFGQCFNPVDGGYDPTNASCCPDAGSGALSGNDLATCLHGYGDPSCAYLLSTISGDGGTNVSYTCSATPPVDGGTSGDGGPSSDGGDGG